MRSRPLQYRVRDSSGPFLITQIKNYQLLLSGTQSHTTSSSAADYLSSVSRPDWKWQMKNRLQSPDDLQNWVNLTENEREGIRQTGDLFRLQITPYYASLMDPNDPGCPVRRQVVPTLEELEDDFDIHNLDPLEEQAHSPVKNLVHNYRDRVAFCVVNRCASYCRYCLRKRMVDDHEHTMNRLEVKAGIEYIRSHPEIRDVLLTGGDPLLLSDQQLEWIITELRSIPHVELIRIGSRFPVFNPYRITDDLCRLLESNHPVWFNTHFNHLKEVTDDAAQAMDRLTKAGVPIGNQTVLLKGINDTPEALGDLFRELVRIRVRPYYLYQANLIGGTRHFRTSIEEGMELMKALRGRISGFAIPDYVLDTPYGKVPLNPHGYVERDGDHVTVQAYGGEKWKEYNPRK